MNEDVILNIILVALSTIVIIAMVIAMYMMYLSTECVKAGYQNTHITHTFDVYCSTTGQKAIKLD